MTRLELHQEMTALAERLALVEAALPQIRAEQRGTKEAMEAIQKGLKELLDEVKKR